MHMAHSFPGKKAGAPLAFSSPMEAKGRAVMDANISKQDWFTRLHGVVYPDAERSDATLS
ncbi:MAG: hypothetical protein BGO16_06960 [Nitrobacter sp. 62-23]|nr:MAG: hypothetical protein BGO16_06960 [Nitrobacter sp. 62-23]